MLARLHRLTTTTTTPSARHLLVTLLRSHPSRSQSRSRSQHAPSNTYHPALIAALAALSAAPLAYAHTSQPTTSQPTTSQPTTSQPTTPQPTTPQPTTPTPIPLSRYAVSDAIQNILPSVVNIRRVTNQRTFLFDSHPTQISCGSGFIISPSGHILTNSHVVADISSDTYLQVTLSTGETYNATIVAADTRSDIAIIAINTDAKLPVAVLGDSDAVRAGEFVVAVGSPLSLSNSSSFGIVSTIHRDLASSTGESSAGLTYLQLDMAINQGSSGGPCVTLDGHVIGICSMKIAHGAEGIGFAIPINFANAVVHDLQTHGYVRRPFVGLTLVSVTPRFFDDIRKDENYRPPRWLENEMRRTNSSKSLGLMVHHITKGGPGDRAGLKMGDVVVEINECSTTTTSQFLQVLNLHVLKDCRLKVRRAASGVVEVVVIRPEVRRKAQAR